MGDPETDSLRRPIDLKGESSNEYWAQFHEDPKSLNYLLFFLHLAEEKGISLDVKLSEAGRENAQKAMRGVGHMGYKIEKSLEEYIKKGLDNRTMLDRFIQDYLTLSFKRTV